MAYQSGAREKIVALYSSGKSSEEVVIVERVVDEVLGRMPEQLESREESLAFAFSIDREIASRIRNWKRQKRGALIPYGDNTYYYEND